MCEYVFSNENDCIPLTFVTVKMEKNQFKLLFLKVLYHAHFLSSYIKAKKNLKHQVYNWTC